MFHTPTDTATDTQHVHLPTRHLDHSPDLRSTERRSRIMIVDDEPLMVAVLKKHLNKNGYTEFTTTTDPTEAEALFLQDRPDLVLLDLRMPQVSGLELLQRFRTVSAVHVPVVVLTSERDEETKLESLALGADDFLSKPVCDRELVTRVRNMLAVKSQHDELSRYAARLERAALIDAVTEVNNRRSFDEHLQRRLQDWRDAGCSFSVLLCDIDKFKQINDTYGHPVGDRFLREVAKRMLASVRNSDLVARFGGEEFALILLDTDLDSAGRVAESVREAIRSTPFENDGGQVDLTISIGVTTVQDDDDGVKLVARADEALYESKRNGRDCCHAHDGDRQIRIEGQTRVEQRTGTRTRWHDKPIDVKAGRVMIVDDEMLNIEVVKRHLHLSGYQDFVTTTHAATAFALIKSARPDVVLLDLKMPEVSGFEILEQIRGSDSVRHLPVLMLTSASESGSKLEALQRGANDFLVKPLDIGELTARVGNALLTKFQHDRLSRYSHFLEQEVHNRTSELSVSRMEAIQCLARAAECRDDHTGAHIIRVGKYAQLVGRALGMSQEEAKQLECAAQLHDVGKIGIPDSILRKPGPLTESEYEVMRGHAQLGAQILSGCTSPVMKLAAQIAHAHHEKWDGSGYPLGLSRYEIPLAARITSLVDVFDALSSERPYKSAFSTDESFEAIQTGSGTHFDPEAVDAFLCHRADVESIVRNYRDELE